MRKEPSSYGVFGTAFDPLPPDAATWLLPGRAAAGLVAGKGLVLARVPTSANEATGSGKPRYAHFGTRTNELPPPRPLGAIHAAKLYRIVPGLDNPAIGRAPGWWGPFVVKGLAASKLNDILAAKLPIIEYKEKRSLGFVESLQGPRVRSSTRSHAPREQVFREEFDGAVVDVASDAVRVLFETDEGPVEQTYPRSQFSGGYVPKIGDNLVAVRLLSLKRKEPRSGFDDFLGLAQQRLSQRDEPWSAEKDARRCALIDKKIQGTLEPAECRELAELQRQALEYFDRVAPPPVEGALRLHERLLKKVQQQVDE